VEFEKNGLGDVVVSYCRDVCADGFCCPEPADAVFLDLPSPWTAVPHAARSLKPGGRLCSFSPCIEQVTKTCDALRKLRFTGVAGRPCHQPVTDVRMVEVLIRPWEVTTATTRRPMLHPPPPRAVASGDTGEGNGTEDAEDKKRKVPETGADEAAPARRVVARPGNEMKGHTGFLTFATAPIARKE